jgi:hypothetical protein
MTATAACITRLSGIGEVKSKEPLKLVATPSLKNKAGRRGQEVTVGVQFLLINRILKLLFSDNSLQFNDKVSWAATSQLSISGKRHDRRSKLNALLCHFLQSMEAIEGL